MLLVDVNAQGLLLATTLDAQAPAAVADAAGELGAAFSIALPPMAVTGTAGRWGPLLAHLERWRPLLALTGTARRCYCRRCCPLLSQLALVTTVGALVAHVAGA